MPLIEGSDISEIVDLLKNRGVNFFHACQFKDFNSYIDLEGLPCRQLLEENSSDYTPFTTDHRDRTNGVWDKVFGNFSDYGYVFAQAQWRDTTAILPNVYGPILLVFEPEVLSEADDIAVCLRSAGAMGFDRVAESLGTSEDVDRIFKYLIDQAPTNFAKRYIKFADELQQEFADDLAKSPEVSCTVSNGKLSFNHLSEIVVDRYAANGERLIDRVQKFCRYGGIHPGIRERVYRENREEIIQELADLLVFDETSADEILSSESSTDLKGWIERLQRGNLIYNFARFTNYLRSGTLLELGT